MWTGGYGIPDRGQVSDQSMDQEVRRPGRATVPGVRTNVWTGNVGSDLAFFYHG